LSIENLNSNDWQNGDRRAFGGVRALDMVARQLDLSID